MPQRFLPDRLQGVLDTIDGLLVEIAAGAEVRAAQIAAVPVDQRPSARNLGHYLAMRRRDLRPLQRQLRGLSLSSLGRMEGNVHETLRGVRQALLALLGKLPQLASADESLLTGDEADQRLARQAERLLGPSPATRTTRIMVTLPSEAAQDPDLVRNMLRAGMDVARINLAHDDAVAWSAMVANLRAASQALGRSCRVHADLPGPKLRTGPLEPGPQVLRLRPERDVFGVTTTPATVWFCDPGAPPRGAAGRTVPLTQAIVCEAQLGDELVVTDTRGRARKFPVVAAEGASCRTTTDRTVYLGTGCPIVLRRDGVDLLASRIGALPPLPSHIPLRVDDTLVVTRDQTPGGAACTRADGAVQPARVPCTLPEVFDAIRPEDRILFDDGKIAGIVTAHDRDSLQVHITNVPPGGGRLRAEKGINLPDTELRATALTELDRGCLDWVARHADLVGMSFVQRPADVVEFGDQMAARGRPDIGIVLKIETASGFQSLPELLFAGLRSPPLGVMVARGDLAVEVGYGRLAEVQEEILWLCEAAHVPVVWATQVLDSMARTGVPSRAEVTDAAMGVQAECVMLNKGPYIAETVQFLGGVLSRMQEHHTKKRSLLRRLRIADPCPDGGPRQR